MRVMPSLEPPSYHYYPPRRSLRRHHLAVRTTFHKDSDAMFDNHDIHSAKSSTTSSPPADSCTQWTPPASPTVSYVMTLFHPLTALLDDQLRNLDHPNGPHSPSSVPSPSYTLPTSSPSTASPIPPHSPRHSPPHIPFPQKLAPYSTYTTPCHDTIYHYHGVMAGVVPRPSTPPSLAVLKRHTQAAQIDATLLYEAHQRATADVNALVEALASERAAVLRQRRRIDALSEENEALRELRRFDARLHSRHLADEARRLVKVVKASRIRQDSGDRTCEKCNGCVGNADGDSHGSRMVFGSHSGGSETIANDNGESNMGVAEVASEVGDTDYLMGIGHALVPTSVEEYAHDVRNGRIAAASAQADTNERCISRASVSTGTKKKRLNAGQLVSTDMDDTTSEGGARNWDEGQGDEDTQSEQQCSEEGSSSREERENGNVPGCQQTSPHTSRNRGANGGLDAVWNAAGLRGTTVSSEMEAGVWTTGTTTSAPTTSTPTTRAFSRRTLRAAARTHVERSILKDIDINEYSSNCNTKGSNKGSTKGKSTASPRYDPSSLQRLKQTLTQRRALTKLNSTESTGTEEGTTTTQLVAIRTMGDTLEDGTTGVVAVTDSPASKCTVVSASTARRVAAG